MLKQTSISRIFFIDFNYLRRNAILNGPIMPSLVSLDPVTPVTQGLKITIEDPHDYNLYRIGLRTTTNDFDTVYTSTEKTTTITGLDMSSQWHYISVAAVDENGIESLFSNEKGSFPTSSTKDLIRDNKVELLQKKPNPFDDRTCISVWVNEDIHYSNAEIEVIKPFGSIIYSSTINLDKGMNEIWYDHSKYHFSKGLLFYRLIVDGKMISTKSMIYAY